VDQGIAGRVVRPRVQYHQRSADGSWRARPSPRETVRMAWRLHGRTNLPAEAQASPIPRQGQRASLARRARNFGHGTKVISGVTRITVCFEASADDGGDRRKQGFRPRSPTTSKAQFAREADREGALENMVPERRRFARYQCSLAVQLRAAGQAYPTSTEITDISLGGCYVKMLLPLPVGTAVEIRVGTDGGEIVAKGTVKTADPSLGNGIAFTEMASSRQLELQHYLQTLPREATGSASVIR